MSRQHLDCKASIHLLQIGHPSGGDASRVHRIPQQPSDARHKAPLQGPDFLVRCRSATKHLWGEMFGSCRALMPLGLRSSSSSNHSVTLQRRAFKCFKSSEAVLLLVWALM